MKEAIIGIIVMLIGMVIAYLTGRKDGQEDEDRKTKPDTTRPQPKPKSHTAVKEAHQATREDEVHSEIDDDVGSLGEWIDSWAEDDESPEL